MAGKRTVDENADKFLAYVATLCTLIRLGVKKYARIGNDRRPRTLIPVGSRSI